MIGCLETDGIDVKRLVVNNEYMINSSICAFQVALWIFANIISPVFPTFEF